MIKGDKQYLLIEKAYVDFKDYCIKNPERVEGSRECVDELNKNLELWDGVSSLDDVIKRCLVGKNADFVAADGPGGKTGQKDFYIFMNIKSTKEAIKRLIEIKQNTSLRVDGKINFRAIKSIQNEGILNLLENYVAVNNKPKILVQRFLCMLFNEVFTSIADYASILKVARKLEIISQSRKASDLEYNKYFEQLQYDIRYKIDEYFLLKGEDVDNHEKFSIAWHIKDVKMQ